MDPITILTIIGVPLLLSSRKKSKEKIKIVETATPSSPIGKGLFVGEINVDRTKFLSDIKQLNLDWIAVLTHAQTDEEFNVKTKEFLNIEKLGWLQTLSDSGIKIWFWATPSAYDIDNFIDILKKYEKYKLTNGYIINIEKQFSSVANAGTVLVNSLKNKTKKPLGLTTYDNSSVLNTLTRLDFGIPKIYSKEINPKNNEYSFLFYYWDKYFRNVLPSYNLIQSTDEITNIIKKSEIINGYVFWNYELLENNLEKFEYVKNIK